MQSIECLILVVALYEPPLPTHTHTPLIISVIQSHSIGAASLSQIDPTAFQSLHSGKQLGYNNQSSVRWMGAEMKIGRFKSCKSFICSPNSTVPSLSSLLLPLLTLWCP